VCCLKSDELQLADISSANKLARLCAVDPLWYVCWIVLLKTCSWPRAANTCLKDRVLVSPGLKYSQWCVWVRWQRHQDYGNDVWPIPNNRFCPLATPNCSTAFRLLILTLLRNWQISLDVLLKSTQTSPCPLWLLERWAWKACICHMKCANVNCKV
jgi:hypothetical protein